MDRDVFHTRATHAIVRALCICAAGMALVLAAGCESARVAAPLTAKLSGNDPDAQLDFWHTLATRNLCSNDEAFHGLLLFLDGADPASDYAGRMKVLRDRDLLPAGFDEPADHAIKRGTLAVAIVRCLKIRGGVMQFATSDHPRYAVRELVYLDLYPPSVPHQTFSGTEFLGIIGRIEDYQLGNPADHPAAVLPGEARGGAPSTMPATVPATRPATGPATLPR